MHASLMAIIPISLVVGSTIASAVSFIPLGDLPGGIELSFAYDVSADGATVVGESWSDDGREAFLWTAQAGMRSLEDVANQPIGGPAHAISADGDTVVGSAGASSAFIWHSTDGVRAWGETQGDLVVWSANDVSADGSVVVGLASEAGRFLAYRWDDRGFTNLGRLSTTGGYTEARGVSGDGSTVVGYGDSGSSLEAFTWNALDGMRSLGDLPGGSVDSVAHAVSADGSIVVGKATTALGREAFIWDAQNGMRGLGVLSSLGARHSEAFDVSADGSVVVGSTYLFQYAGEDPEWEPDFPIDPSHRAFVWDRANGMRAIDEILIAAGVDLGGWKLQSAQAVSGDGNTIVGYGLDANNMRSAWIAVIPEPGTALLLGMGLAALAARGRADRSKPDGSRLLRRARPVYGATISSPGKYER